MIRAAIFGIALACSGFGSHAIADTGSGAPPSPPPKAVGDPPAFELREAVQRAEDFARLGHINLQHHYLHGAAFDEIKRAWTVAYQVPNAKGGRIEFAVPESGKITVNLGE